MLKVKDVLPLLKLMPPEADINISAGLGSEALEHITRVGDSLMLYGGPEFDPDPNETVVI